MAKMAKEKNDTGTVKESKEPTQALTIEQESTTAEMQAAIYVGPLIKGTILVPMTIFEEGVPQEYKGHPIFKHLFVAPDRLDQARQEIGRKGSLRNTYYHRAISEFQKKGSE